MQIKENNKIITYILIFSSFFLFFLGFYLNENAAGAGLLTGDISIIWNNLQIFIKNDITTSIHHEDYYSSRTPLVYIFHKLFNPFTENIIHFRRSVFIISLTLPIVFYLCLKKNFIDQDKSLLLLIASIVYLSPYFRTSAYWGLEENFGSIFLLFSFLSLSKFLDSENKNLIKVQLLLLLTTFFSSCCLYFDQKLIIVPLICFVKIITSSKILKLKLFSVLYYLVFAQPFIYLIVLWEGLIPSALSDPESGRKLGNEIFLIHIGYASTMIAFYLLPLLFFKNKNLLSLIKNFFITKKNYYLILLFFIYLLFLIIFSDFNNQSNIGKGFIHKTSLLLFSETLPRMIFVYFSFFISWVIILIYIERNFIDILVIVYLLLLSIFIWPIFQEYFDPLILLMAFTFFNSKLFINYRNTLILFAYTSLLLLATNIYYINLLN